MIQVLGPGDWSKNQILEVADSFNE